MSNLTTVEFDNDCGAFVRDCLDGRLATARRVVIVYEADDGTWCTHWMNVKPYHRTYVAALLLKEAAGDKAWVNEIEPGAS